MALYKHLSVVQLHSLIYIIYIYACIDRGTIIPILVPKRQGQRNALKTMGIIYHACICLPFFADPGIHPGILHVTCMQVHYPSWSLSWIDSHLSLASSIGEDQVRRAATLEDKGIYYTLGWWIIRGNMSKSF